MKWIYVATAGMMGVLAEAFLDAREAILAESLPAQPKAEATGSPCQTCGKCPCYEHERVTVVASGDAPEPLPEVLPAGAHYRDADGRVAVISSRAKLVRGDYRWFEDGYGTRQVRPERIDWAHWRSTRAATTATDAGSGGSADTATREDVAATPSGEAGKGSAQPPEPVHQSLAQRAEGPSDRVVCSGWDPTADDDASEAHVLEVSVDGYGYAPARVFRALTPALRELEQFDGGGLCSARIRRWVPAGPEKCGPDAPPSTATGEAKCVSCDGTGEIRYGMSGVHTCARCKGSGRSPEPVPAKDGEGGATDAEAQLKWLRIWLLSVDDRNLPKGLTRASLLALVGRCLADVRREKASRDAEVAAYERFVGWCEFRFHTVAPDPAVFRESLASLRRELAALEGKGGGKA